MKRMLFNATHSEELRVATVDGQKLIDIDIESAGRENRKSNIYQGVITRIEPGLEACFVNYGEERHGFLPFKEISRQYFKQGVDVGRARIQDVLSEGQTLLVQIDKEERGNKGAALTTFISLAGRYLVLMPNNPRGGGVSRRVEGEERQELRETLDKLEVPQGTSLIARTAGIGRNAEELQWDLNYLMQLWTAIDGAKGGEGAYLIYQESSLVIRAIRDYFTADVGEILIDTDEIYEQARQFMGHVMPDNVGKVKRYRDDTPLFSRFQIEHQIETAHSRLVPLPSGGAIVIDHTEALVAIDVNSARSTKGADIEETALRTNLEAAEEVGRQMRLRDLGGLIVIDFIDMEVAKNQREVEQRIKDALHYDRARVQAGKISKFGLMELSRQRLRPALNEGSHLPCPRCGGTGVIRDIESSALHVLRQLQDEAMKENSSAVYCQVPVDVATYLLNEKRAEITKLEARLKVEIVLIPNKNLETPHYKLERLKHDDERLNTYRATYTLAEAPDQDDSYLARKLEPDAKRQEAVVKGITPSQPAPMPTPVAIAAPAPALQERVAMPVRAATTETSSDGFFGRLLNLFKPKPGKETAAAVVTTATTAEKARETTREGRDGKPANGRDANREGARDGRRGRNERGGKNRNERPERAERAPRDENRNNTPREERKLKDESGAVQNVAQNATQNTNPNTRQPNERRPRQEPRAPRHGNQTDTVQVAKASNIEGGEPITLVDGVAQAPGHTDLQVEGGEQGQDRSRNRNRRRRGRGDRTERGDRPEQNDAQDDSAVNHGHDNPVANNAAAGPVPTAIAAVAAVGGVAAFAGSVSENWRTAEPAPSPLAAPAMRTEAVTEFAPRADRAPSPTAPVVSAPVATYVEPVRTLEPAAIAAPATTPVSSPMPAQAPAPVAVAPALATPAVDLNSVVSSAGLQWVQTTAPVQTSFIEEVMAKPRQPRVRKPKPVIVNEPLQMVETENKKPE
jgi:ribonuclease E